MGRPISIQHVYSKKHKLLPFEGIWKEVFGDPEQGGNWIIWGAEKHGKTRFAILLADYLSKFKKTLYISAEEGIGAAFSEACRWASIHPGKKLLGFLEYTPIEDLKELLRKRRAPEIVILDNITIYNDELKNGVLRSLLKEFPRTLFVLIAHEDRNDVYTATGKLASKLAHIRVYVEGLACTVSGRCPGGQIYIDETKAKLYHGTQKNKTNG